MNREEIVSFLEDNEITDIEFIKDEDGVLVARFFYVFDESEISAAENYEESLTYTEDGEDDYGDGDMEQDSFEAINSDTMSEDEIDPEELDEEESMDDDYEEEDGMLSYLSDIAIDHVGEVLEDLKDELGIDVQYIGYNMDEDNMDSYEFIALFQEEGSNHDIDEELEELGL